MHTTYYTLTAREIVMSGDGVREAAGGCARQLVCVRQDGRGQSREGRDNVIDLSAWRADREKKEAADDAPWKREAGTADSPARRPRRDHRALMRGEWLATLSVIAAMVVLVVKIIVF